jgi:biopolymer transport protein TolR
MAPPIGPGGGRHKHRRRRSRPMSDINVTPFVDVMLVLLIVFMVTAPLLSAGVPVDLPDAQAKPLALEKEPITVTVDTQGRVFIKDAEVTMDDLVPKLTAAAANGLDERIYVRGDKAVSYGTIMKVMGTISSAGFTHIGLVALKQPDS